MMINGYEEKAETEMYMLAWHACNIINSTPYLKRKVTPKQLLGKENRASTPLEKEAQKQKLRKLMGWEGGYG